MKMTQLASSKFEIRNFDSHTPPIIEKKKKKRSLFLSAE